VPKFKLNDFVTVTRVVDSHTEGWNNNWEEPDMTKCIGHEFKIIQHDDRDKHGYHLHHTCECCGNRLNSLNLGFPPTALAKCPVKSKEPKELKESTEPESELEDLIFQ